MVGAFGSQLHMWQLWKVPNKSKSGGVEHSSKEIISWVVPVCCLAAS